VEILFTYLLIFFVQSVWLVDASFSLFLSRGLGSGALRGTSGRWRAGSPDCHLCIGVQRINNVAPQAGQRATTVDIRRLARHGRGWGVRDPAAAFIRVLLPFRAVVACGDLFGIIRSDGFAGIKVLLVANLCQPGASHFATAFREKKGLHHLRESVPL